MSEDNNSGEVYVEDAVPVANEDHSQQDVGQKTVPLDALQAERHERQRLQEELKIIKDHISLMQSNQNLQNSVKKEVVEEFHDDDIVTYKDLKKVLGKKEQQYQMSIEELRMTQKYPDYQETIIKYLPEVLKQNPSLQKTLAENQDYELAYYLAKNSDSYKSESKKTKKNADAERIVQNASRPGSLSSVGRNSPISEAKRYKEMSDSEFRSLANRNMG